MRIATATLVAIIAVLPALVPTTADACAMMMPEDLRLDELMAEVDDAGEAQVEVALADAVPLVRPSLEVRIDAPRADVGDPVPSGDPILSQLVDQGVEEIRVLIGATQHTAEAPVETAPPTGSAPEPSAANTLPQS